MAPVQRAAPALRAQLLKHKHAQSTVLRGHLDRQQNLEQTRDWDKELLKGAHTFVSYLGSHMPKEMHRQAP